MAGEKKVYTFTVSTNGLYQKVTNFCDIKFVDDNLYSIQILGNAKLTYSTTLPEGDEGYSICFSKPFTYEKKAGEDLYLKTGTNSVIMTIGE